MVEAQLLRPHEWHLVVECVTVLPSRGVGLHNRSKALYRLLGVSFYLGCLRSGEYASLQGRGGCVLTQLPRPPFLEQFRYQLPRRCTSFRWDARGLWLLQWLFQRRESCQCPRSTASTAPAELQPVRSVDQTRSRSVARAAGSQPPQGTRSRPSASNASRWACLPTAHRVTAVWISHERERDHWRESGRPQPAEIAVMCVVPRRQF